MILVYDEVAHWTKPGTAYVCCVDTSSTIDPSANYAKVFIPWWEDETARKLARQKWLAFTRGNGWTTAAGLRAKSGHRRTPRPTLIPGARLARRPKALRAWRSLKTIRRQERKAMNA